MTSAISNKGLKNKVLRYLVKDTARGDLDNLAEDAIITSSREISDLGKDIPLHWNKERYSELFTRYYAAVSAITAASPGVITAETVDPNLSSAHGYSTGDIIYLEGVNGVYSLHRLNQRLFRVVKIAAATLSLKSLDGQTAIDTTSYEVYDSGGTIYHAGIVLPASTIEPTGGTAAYEWDIKRVYNVSFDGSKCNPITWEGAVEKQINRPGGQPYRWNYQQYAYGDFTSDEHLLMWFPYPSQRFNIEVFIEKDYPDISTFSASVYPPHPPFIHDFIWRRALAKLAGHGDRQRRRSAGKEGEQGDNTKIEVMNAAYWIREAAKDEMKILDYSRKLEGNQAFISEGISA